MATMFSPTAEKIRSVSSFRLMKYSCSAICFPLNLLTGVGENIVAIVPRVFTDQFLSSFSMF